MSVWSAAGYSGSSLTTDVFGVTMGRRGEPLATGEEGFGGSSGVARSLSASGMSLVNLQNNSSPENTQGHDI